LVRTLFIQSCLFFLKAIRQNTSCLEECQKQKPAARGGAKMVLQSLQEQYHIAFLRNGRPAMSEGIWGNSSGLKIEDFLFSRHAVSGFFKKIMLFGWQLLLA